MSIDFCQICGNKSEEETKRCPHCKRIGEERHFTEYHDEELLLIQYLCETCLFKQKQELARIREEKKKEQWKKTRKEAIFWSKIFTAVSSLLILAWVLRWILTG